MVGRGLDGEEEARANPIAEQSTYKGATTVYPHSPRGWGWWREGWRRRGEEEREGRKGWVGVRGVDVDVNMYVHFAHTQSQSQTQSQAVTDTVTVVATGNHLAVKSVKARNAAYKTRTGTPALGTPPYHPLAVRFHAHVRRRFVVVDNCCERVCRARLVSSAVLILKMHPVMQLHFTWAAINIMRTTPSALHLRLLPGPPS